MMKKLLFTLATGAFLATGSVAQTNMDLESWTGTECDGWGTLNSFTFLGAPQTTYQETVDVGEGSNSARLVSGYWAGATGFGAPSDTVSGFLSIGGSPGTGPRGIAYNGKPASVDFMMKADCEVGDTGAVFVQLSHWDTALTMQVIDAQTLVALGDSTGWIPISAPLFYFTTDTPDTLQIVGVSSMGTLFGAPMPIINSSISVDAFVLVGVCFPTVASMTAVVDTLDGTFTAAASNNPNATYAWDFGDGANGTGASATHTYVAGDYNVCLTVTDSCGTATSCDSVTAGTPVGIDEDLAIKGFNVYPNPATDFVSIKVGSANVMDVQLYDLRGQLILDVKNVPAQEYKIAGADLAKGAYLVKVTAEGKQASKMVIFE